MPTRRRMLQYGLAGSAVLLTGSRSAPSQAPPPEPFCRLPTGAQLAASPAVEPFTVPLRLPRVAQPVARGDVDRYEFVMRQAQVEILPGLRTTVWGYDGEFPGPTIVARRGQPVVIRQTNQLPEPVCVHLHGACVAPEHDGHPNDLIEPGEAREYVYPNEQRAATLWYHDHAVHRTAVHVYRGLAGMYLLGDDADDDLALPTGAFDLPLLLQDRAFDASGALSYPEGSHSGVYGDVMLVNGVPQPFADVAPARYRLRLVNGSNARSYTLAWQSGTPLVQIASDGGLLAAPAEAPSLALAPGERIELLADFAALGSGASDVLCDVRGRADLLRFQVQEGNPVPGARPTALRAVEVLGPAVATREVRLLLDEDTQTWTFDGRSYDPARVDFLPRLGTVETWRFTNASPMEHPVHLHLVQFQVQARDGQAPAPAERGWKDTVLVAPGETVTVAARFERYTGRFIYHCHNLEHEDHDMMAQFAVVDVARHAGAGRAETAAAVSAATFSPGVPVAVVATGDDFPDALAAGPAAARLRGPVLLVVAGGLPAATRDELARLAPQRILVVGGERAVPEAVAAELAGIAPVERVAGADRYATAAAVAARVFPAGLPVAYVASGAGFADALAGGAAAALDGAAVLLVAPDRLPSAVADELRRLAPARIVVLGGPRAVGDEVVAELERIAPTTRLAGESRFDTAAAVSAATFAPGAAAVFVAAGDGFADALAGVAAAGVAGAPLLPVAADGVPPAVAVEIARLAPRRIVVLGGTAVVPAAVEEQLARLIAR